MKRCLQIFPKGKSPLDIPLGEDIEQFPFDRNEIAEDTLDDEIVWHYLLEERLSNQTYDVVLIDSAVRNQEATIIIAHIRLSPEEKVSGIPIIFYNKKKLAETLNTPILKHKDTLINCNVNYIWEDNYDNDTVLAEKLKSVIINNTQSQLVDISLLHFRQNDEGTRHQVTNEWGAFLLAHVAGLDKLATILFNDNLKSKTIYFKYLKLFHNIELVADDETITTPAVTLSTKKYLFIDDNYDKGWFQVFNAILGQADSELGLEAYTDVLKFENQTEDSNTFQEIIGQINQNNYQGILLDLRLTNADNNLSRLNTDIDEFTGGRLLKKIKDSFPHIPVIMTTASNKAWNMEQLLDEGADGYFIKQGPDSLPNENMARENYDSFVKLIKESQKKYNRLQPFLQYIKDIEQQATLIEERQVSITQTDGTQVSQTTKVEERIIERLNMFFGLLKRSFEDSSYNKRFHYSDYKLAFMTLWSCLNDIQYIYYDKNKPMKEIKIRQFLATKMSINSIQNFFLQRKITPTSPFQSFITLNEGNPYYTFTTSNVKYDRRIGAQIAFIILTLNEGTVTDETNGAITAEKLCDNLLTLKNIRNKLFLIHGNEDEGSDFFVKTEAENIQIDLQDCAKLFEIVYFLLKGTLINLEF